MIFLTKVRKPTSCQHSENREGITWKILFLFFFPACSVQQKSWQPFIWSGRSRTDLPGLSMVADLLLYAWIAYNGCSWTIGYKKIFIHGIWFFQEADVLLTKTAKKSFFCLCIPQGRRQYDPFFWFLFSLYPFLAVLPAGKMLLMLSAYSKLFRKTG